MTALNHETVEKSCLLDSNERFYSANMKDLDCKTDKKDTFIDGKI